MNQLIWEELVVTSKTFIKYLQGIRNNFKPIYFQHDLNETNKSDIYSIKSIIKNPETKKMLENFLHETEMADKIEIEEYVSQTTKNTLIEPLFIKNNKKMNLSLSGSGISQVLPILTSLFEIKQKLFIEQPEIHLHPRAQSALGRIIGNCHNKIAKNGKKISNWNQLFIETHSLYMIDSFRHTLYKENKEVTFHKNSYLASLIYLENSKSSTEIENIVILPNGKLKGNVDKFNDFFIEENLKIMEI